MMAARAAQFSEFHGRQWEGLSPRVVSARFQVSDTRFQGPPAAIEVNFPNDRGLGAADGTGQRRRSKSSPDYWSPDAQHRRWLQGKCSNSREPVSMIAVAMNSVGHHAPRFGANGSGLDGECPSKFIARKNHVNLRRSISNPARRKTRKGCRGKNGRRTAAMSRCPARCA